MAVTKILSIKQRVDNRINYICNPEKTEGGVLVSAYNCEPDSADFDFALTKAAALHTPWQTNSQPRKHNIEAYHIIQSFSPDDDVTPEEAHQIGKELADKLLKGRYEYVIATHTDKEHIHNHIIFNSTSFVTFFKFRTQPYKTVQEIQRISDRLCIEHDLSVIQHPQKLGHSYAEWKARQTNTSWRSELRKRLQFAAMRSISYDDFLKKCDELHVAVDDDGKHIKFMLRDLPQQRWTRGNKLTNDKRFTESGIKAQISMNALLYKTLTDALTELVPRCTTWEKLRWKLMEKGIRITQGKNGIKYVFPNGVVRSVRELGGAFSEEAIRNALEQGYFSAAQTQNLKEEWVKNQHDSKFIPVELPEDAVEKISLDGLLVKLPDEEQTLFVDSSHVDFEPETGRYTIWLAPTYHYYCVAEKRDPDLLESEQLGEISFRGNDLIQKMERGWGGGEQWIEVPSDLLVSASPKGALLKLPDLSDQLIHVLPEDLEMNQSSCKVRIFPHWSYGKNVNGEDVINAVKSYSNATMVDLLWVKYRTYERRCQQRELQVLSDVLWTLNDEEISEKEDFQSREQEINQQISEERSLIRNIEEECDEYTRIVACLNVVADYEELYSDWQAATPGQKLVIEQKNLHRLQLYERAMMQLKRSGMNPSADPIKIEEYVEFNRREIQERRQKIEKLSDRLYHLYATQRGVDRILSKPTLEGAAKQLQRRHEYTL